jgi:hypothetical protein
MDKEIDTKAIMEINNPEINTKKVARLRISSYLKVY